MPYWRERREGRRSTSHSDIGPLESKSVLHKNLHLTFLVTAKKDWRFRRVSSEVSSGELGSKEIWTLTCQ